VKARSTRWGAPDLASDWLAAPVAWAAQTFESLSDELIMVDLDGTEAWVLAADRTPPSGRPSGVRLLPYFDSYIVGSHPRARLFPGVAGQRALSRTGQAGTMPVLLVNGEVAGVWRMRRSGKRLRITVEPFRDVTARQYAQLEHQVERTAAILEGAPDLAIGPIAAGHHL